MDRYDLLEAMSGIRDEYIAAASVDSKTAAVEDGKEEAGKDVSAAGTGHRTLRRAGILRMQRWAGAAAAILCLSIIVPNVSPGAANAFQDLPLLGQYFRAVTFRAYEYQDERADAYVEEPAIVTMGAADTQKEKNTAGNAQDEPAEMEEAMAADNAWEESAEIEGAMAGGNAPEQDADAGKAMAAGSVMAAGNDVEESAEAEMEAAPAFDAGGDPAAKTGGLQIAESMEPSSFETAQDEAADAVLPASPGALASGNGDAGVQAALSAAQITQEIRSMVQKEIEVFEKSIAEETGYHGLCFLHETVTDSVEWFCLSVLTYTSSADGFEQVTHFAVDKQSGERVELEDLFVEGSDYVTPISAYIREEMRRQMAEDPDVEYMIDTEEGPEFEFQEISASQDFYIDENGSLVICFDELEVAPMYMGTVEFVIPDTVAADIRK